MRLHSLTMCVLVFTAWTSSVFASSSKIAGAVVEDAAAAQLIRLALAPTNSNKPINHKVICGNDSIRIRLNGISQEEEKIQELKVSSVGPLRRVRIVPKLGGSSVVQMFARGRTLATCARTSVMELNGNIVISVALSQRDIKRRDKILKINKVEKKEPQEEDRQETIKTEKQKESNHSKLDNKTDKKKEDKKKASSIFGKKSKEKEQDEIGATSDDDEQTFRYAAGFLFAALIAGFAWYAKKKKQGLTGTDESIDIVCARRLNSHQQLIVASVCGTKFLLSVGDKSVTTLGMVPTQNEAPSNLSFEPGNLGNVSQTNKSLTEMLASLSSGVNAESLPSVPVQQPNMQQNANSMDDGFKQQLKNALETRPPIENNSYQSAAPASNVAGLINMARMRANLNRSAKEAHDLEA